MESNANPGSIESGIDKARGCRLTNIAPRTHVRYGHRDRSIRRERDEDRRKESMKEMIRRFGDRGGGDMTSSSACSLFWELSH